MKNLISFTVKNTWSIELMKNQIGWGNGYVAIPPDSVLYNLPYDILERLPTKQEITYVRLAKFFPHKPDYIDDDYLILGFDTMHCGQNPVDNNKQWVEEETSYFLKEIEEIAKKEILFSIPEYRVMCPHCSIYNNLDYYTPNYTTDYTCNHCQQSFYCWFKYGEDNED